MRTALLVLAAVVGLSVVGPSVSAEESDPVPIHIRNKTDVKVKGIHAYEAAYYVQHEGYWMVWCRAYVEGPRWSISIINSDTNATAFTDVPLDHFTTSYPVWVKKHQPVGCRVESVNESKDITVKFLQVKAFPMDYPKGKLIKESWVVTGDDRTNMGD